MKERRINRKLTWNGGGKKESITWYGKGHLIYGRFAWQRRERISDSAVVFVSKKIPKRKGISVSFFSLLLLWLFSRVSMRSSSHSSRMANKQTREDFLSQWENTHWKYIHIDRLSDGNEAAALLRSLLLLFPLGPHPRRSPSAQSGWPPSSPPLESFFFSTVSIFFSFVEYFRPSSW